MKPKLLPVPVLPLACALAFSFSACAEKPKPEPPPPAPAVSAPPQAAAADAGESAPPGEEASAPTTAPEIPVITPYGVPECDNYVKKFTACLEAKVSPEQWGPLLAGFEASRAKWRALATMREGALALGLACKAAAQKSKEELAVDYGCDF
jgi:hypothetical protein